MVTGDSPEGVLSIKIPEGDPIPHELLRATAPDAPRASAQPRPGTPYRRFAAFQAEDKIAIKTEEDLQH